MTVQIKGLVRAYGHVREQLRDGVAPADAARFRRQVEGLIQQVEAICRQHRVTPDRLPAPSRRVYRFLKELDLAALPLRQPDAPAPRAAGLRLTNLVAAGNHLADRLWQERETLESSPARHELHAAITRHALNVEQLCARHGLPPAAMAAPSRTVYCWLKFLADVGNFTLHLRALRRAHGAVRAFGQQPAPPVEVRLTYIGALWRTRASRAATVLAVNEGFLAADDDVWSALGWQSLGSCDAAARKVVEAFAGTEAFSAVLYELASFASSAAELRGRFHDLGASFVRVNAAYFAGKLVPPALCWSTVPTARTFGHYQQARDAVMVSVSLDVAGVPDFVIDHVMHHELLHKQMGVTEINGRLSAHGPAFRAAERRYARHSEAEAFLHTLAGSL